MQCEPVRFPPQVRNGDLVFGELCCAAVEDLPACLLHHCRFDVVQLEHGASCCDLDFVAGSRAAVCRQRIARTLHLRGAMTGGWIGLGLVSEGKPGEGKSGKARDDLLHLALPGTPFDWYLRAGQSLLLVMAGYDALLELAGAAHAETGVRKAIGMGDKISRLRLDGAVAAEERGTLLDLLEDARRGDLDGNGRAFAQAVLEAMVLLLDAADDAGPSRGSAEPLVRRARDIVGEAPQRFSISQLSGELRVSPRTLYNAFIEITGVGPHNYFLRQRLNAARHQLAAADPRRETVTNIALELGFIELGRFAGRYRAFFGENPSQTLQRPAREIEPLPA
jgi:AraC-like DNA-binding protein